MKKYGDCTVAESFFLYHDAHGGGVHQLNAMSSHAHKQKEAWWHGFIDTRVTLNAITWRYVVKHVFPQSFVCFREDCGFRVPRCFSTCRVALAFLLIL